MSWHHVRRARKALRRRLTWREFWINLGGKDYQTEPSKAGSA